MRKTLSLLLLLSALSFYAHSATIYVDGLKYSTNITTNTASLTGYEEEKPIGKLIIPTSIIVEDVEYTITSIGDHAFSGCSGLFGELIIPDSVTYIGSFSFSGCTGFSGELIIPNSATSIESYAFFWCTGFSGKLIIPNSVTYIGNYAFSGCSGFLGELTIPNMITFIGDGTFNKCSGFSGELTIPNSVTTINGEAFNECTGFSGELIIPDSVTYIGNAAFNECTGFSGELTIPNTVTYIGNYAFSGCTGFSGKLTIPSSVITIGDEAFYKCSKLTDVKVDWETPLTVTSSFVFSTYSSATLSVPVGTLAAYQADYFWGQFINIVEDSSLAVEGIEVDETKLYVTNNGTLNISGAVDGVDVKVYNLNGVVVANGVVIDNTAQIELPITNGIYIVTIGNKSYKVIR